jgi:hypothetical protein
VKTHFATIVVFLGVGCAFAAEAPTLQFGGERIGVPPLSLSESLGQRSPMQTTPKFGAKLPQLTTGTEPAPLSPELVPRTVPDLKHLETSRPAPRHRVSRSSGMPILEPSDAVDYKLTIVSPDPAIDFKLVIKDPSPAGEKSPPK